ncbi:MAG: DUF4914 family protein [Fimbriimonadaceae bacterium]
MTHRPPVVPPEVLELSQRAPSFRLLRSVEEIRELVLPDPESSSCVVEFEVEGRGTVREAWVQRCRNGISVNYYDPYLRRRDPGCLYVGDDLPTDKPRFDKAFGVPFAEVRRQALEWLGTQDLVAFAFLAGGWEKGIPSLAVCPANAGFFAYGLALLQGVVDIDDVPGFEARSVIYVAPPFRHSHFGGKQVVVHFRQGGIHELHSFNLYPGPSAKKGVYGVLLNAGEQEGWLTAHCSTVQVVTPYDNVVTFMHEGASGGGKSEFLEHVHREPDGRLLLGQNTVTGDRRYLTLPRACELRPVTDDMALCHPSFQENKRKLSVMDAESAWFVRVNHIQRYGTDPNLEALTISPAQPLLFLNLDTVPGSTALIWEHIEDEPGKKCPNPRVVIPRSIVPNVVDGPVEVDIRSFGVRTPPCTKDAPTYGILGLFHVLPPALAWLWRLVAPRGHDNPSVVEAGAMGSEGVGSYWPFATGLRVDQANLLLEQFRETKGVDYILIPNQHVGAWRVGFMPQWIAREYLARKGNAKFRPDQLTPARSPLLGWALQSLMVEGTTIPYWFLQVDKQADVGPEAYDAGARILREFFETHLPKFERGGLHPLGRRIIHCFRQGGTVEDFAELL